MERNDFDPALGLKCCFEGGTFSFTLRKVGGKKKEIVDPKKPSIPRCRRLEIGFSLGVRIRGILHKGDSELRGK